MVKYEDKHGWVFDFKIGKYLEYNIKFNYQWEERDEQKEAR